MKIRKLILAAIEWNLFHEIKAKIHAELWAKSRNEMKRRAEWNETIKFINN